MFVPQQAQAPGVHCPLAQQASLQHGWPCWQHSVIVPWVCMAHCLCAGFSVVVGAACAHSAVAAVSATISMSAGSKKRVRVE